MIFDWDLKGSYVLIAILDAGCTSPFERVPEPIERLLAGYLNVVVGERS